MEMKEDISFLDHLDILRSVLFKILAVFALFCIPAWFASQWVLDQMLDYAAPAGFKLHYFSLMEPFFIRMKVMFALAFFVSLPFCAWFLWGFLAPALTGRERRLLRISGLMSFFLALGGGAFALFLIVPAVVTFSLSFAGPSMEPLIGIDSFASMMLLAMLACALLFQFPVAMLILLVLGVTDVAAMRRKRSIVIVIIFVIAAIVTPPDVISQLLVAVPTYLLYEVTLFLFLFYRKPDDSLAVYQNEEKRTGTDDMKKNHSS